MYNVKITGLQNEMVKDTIQSSITEILDHDSSSEELGNSIRMLKK